MSDEPLSSEEVDKKAEMMRTAAAASHDLERALQELEELQIQRRKNPLIEARYERLRKATTDLLREHGPRYFLDSNGHKKYAYALNPETTVVEVADLEALRDEGVITEEDLDRVAPRKVKTEEFKRLVALKTIPLAKAKKIARIVPKTPYVGFAEEDEREVDEE